MTTAFEQLQAFTFEVRHNPNCPSPFLIITCGDAGRIERDDRRNLYSYGKTLEEAADRALKANAAYDRRKAEERTDRDRARRIEQEQRRLRGLVWA